MLLNRTMFVGAGTIGVNAVFRAKRRLSMIVGPNHGNLLKKDELDHNPFQFLALHAGEHDVSSNPASVIFKYRRVSGLDDDLFQSDNEIASIKDEPNQLLNTFKAAIRRLLAFNGQTYHGMTGVTTSILPPAVLLVLDIEHWKDDAWRQHLIQILKPEEPTLYDGTGHLRYHVHGIVFCPRQQHNRSYAQDFLQFLHSLYFFDNEGPFPFEMPDDAIEQAANLLNTAALLNDNDYKNWFNDAFQQRCFSFGSSRLHYPKNRMVNEAALLNLGNPEFGQKGGQGKWFFKCFLGSFIKRTQEGPDDTFAIGDEDRDALDGGPETYRPEIRPSAINRAQKLYAEAEQWLEDHSQSIKKHLEKDSLLQRIRELTRPATFLKIFVEKWHDSLDFLEFLMKNEVLQDARLRSEKIKADFYKRWINKSTGLYSRARKIINHDGDILSEHPGETTWELSRTIIAHVRDNVIPSYRNQKVDTEYQPSAGPNRAELEKEIRKLPRPASLLSRLALFTAIMVFGWPDFHFLLAKWKFQNLSSIPPWITGLAIGVPIVIIALWLAYGKKVKDLREVLGLYLQARQKAWEAQIQIIEEKLVTGFLTDCIRYIKTDFTIRQGFFYQLIDNKKYSFKEIQADGYDGFSKPPNALETYYLNRFIIYSRIQSVLADTLQYQNYSLSILMPDPIGDEYKQIVEEKAIQAQDCGQMVSSKTIADMLENNMLWSLNLSDPEISSKEAETTDEETDAAAVTGAICKSIISRLCYNIEERFNSDNEHKDLAAYLSSINYEMPRETSQLLSGRSDTTFRLTTEPVPDLTILSGNRDYFPGNVDTTETLDNNSIIYLKIDGPVGFDHISWREDDVSTSI